MKKVFITGIKGFLGARLGPYLSQFGYVVTGCDRNACDLSNEREKPDFVIHLAARTNPERSLTEFSNQYHDTILTAQNVALCLPDSVRLAIFSGSIEEYGASIAPFHESASPLPVSAYGWAKVTAHSSVKMICEERKRPFTWIRPSLLYGPGMSTSRFIGLVINAYATGKAAALTPCQQFRDFLYIDDCCARIRRILETPQAAEGKTFNVTTETRMQLVDALDEIFNVVSSVQKLAKTKADKIPVGSIPYRNNEMMNFYSSSELFNATFGSVETTSFHKGIQKTVEWFFNHRPAST
jgi:UDP-glucose 4-epimerase